MPTAPVAALQQKAAAESPHAVRGIAVMVIGVGLFSIMDSLVKYLGGIYHPLEVVFFRGWVAFVPIVAVIMARGGFATIRTRKPGSHALRCVIGLGSTLLFFIALAGMPLADAIAISFAGPLFVTALSQPLLGEAVGRHRWGAVIVGFLGVILILRPGTNVIEPMAAVALAATVCYALSTIAIRRLSVSESDSAMVFYYNSAVTLAATITLPFVWSPPSAWDLALLSCVGLLGGISGFFVTRAYRLAPAALVAPFEYTAMLWALVIGQLAFDETPGLGVLTGSAVVVASGLYILYRETRYRRAAKA
ncbi:MAG: DMT family transporter [Proteobacteria bacterium]|nr:DMT family transporter [Pseudomonadota bacterium]MBI3497328.1 DMT family transporter [Pseudomonadota bacterium]